MRATALLVLLVVLVSFGESLKCYYESEGVKREDECRYQEDSCAHVISSKYGVMRKCLKKEFCDRLPELHKETLRIHKCCTTDLCN
uniref:Plethodontid modulating factor n=1 Tax=Aneides ferreus TaxID=154578 RepID=Q0GAB6_9SALA|nr:plethodontid modulating factor [Aneides ferreus]